MKTRLRLGLFNLPVRGAITRIAGLGTLILLAACGEEGDGFC